MLQKIKKMDKKLIEKLARGELTDDEFRRLLAQNRENIDKLRKERGDKRLKQLQLLEKRRANQSRREVSASFKLRF